MSAWAGFISTMRSVVTSSASHSIQGGAGAASAAPTRSFAACQPAAASESKACSQRALICDARARRGKRADDVEVRGHDQRQLAALEFARESERRRCATRRAALPSPARVSGSACERRPERRGSRARTAALEADLAEMELARGEIGVGRVVRVEAARRRGPRTARSRTRRAAARACADRRRSSRPVASAVERRAGPRPARRRRRAARRSRRRRRRRAGARRVARSSAAISASGSSAPRLVVPSVATTVPDPAGAQPRSSVVDVDAPEVVLGERLRATPSTWHMRPCV